MKNYFCLGCPWIYRKTWKLESAYSFMLKYSKKNSVNTIWISRLSNLTPSLNSKPSNEGLNTDLLLFLPSQIVAEQTLPDSASDLFIGSFQTANITLGCTVCYSCSNLSHCQINKEIYIRRAVAFSCIQCPNVVVFLSCLL